MGGINIIPSGGGTSTVLGGQNGGVGPQFYQQYRTDPRLMLAQALMEQGSSTAPVQSPLEGISRALTGVVGGWQGAQTRREYEDRTKGYNEALAGALAPEKSPWVNPDTGMTQPEGYGRISRKLLESGNPDATGLAAQMSLQDAAAQREAASRMALAQMEQENKGTVLGPNQVLFRGGKEVARGPSKSVETLTPEEAARLGLPAGVVAQRDTEGKISVVSKPDEWSAEKMAQLLALANARQASEPLVAIDDGAGGTILVPRSQAVGKTPGVKPGSTRLPPAALSLQKDELDAIATASTIGADLSQFEKMIDEGGLKLGPVANISSQARNVAGLSTPESRNYATFKANLEKLRNDSLRLNKGIQTEGDAVRAWNELIASINDPKVVKQRLSEIRRINDRAVTLRKMNIDVIRRNYGAEPLDTEAFTKQPPAVGPKPGADDVNDLLDKYAPK